MLTGYTTNLPADTILDSGVVFKADTPIGVTMGGTKFDPGKTVRNTEFDGKRSEVQGNDRVIGWAPKLTFTMIEFGGTGTGDQISLVEPGATTVNTGHVSTKMGTIATITPKPANEFFATGEYETDVRIIFERAGGGYAAVLFPIALCTKYDLAGQDKNEGKVNVELTAKLSAADTIATPGKCPYAIELRTALPS